MTTQARVPSRPPSRELGGARIVGSGPSAFNYLDIGVAGPSGIIELMPGARNLMDYAQVKPGEQVLILVEHTVDPLVVQAICAAAAYRNAIVHLLYVSPFSAGGWDRANPSPAIAAMHAQADVVISCCWWGEVHTAPLFFSVVWKAPARWVSLHMTATASAFVTGARFPPELFYEIKRKVIEQSQGQELRVTTASGTDVTFRDLNLDAEITAGPVRPSVWVPFPYGGVNFKPVSTDGVIVIEESTVTGIPESHVAITFRDNLVVDVEGGAAADQVRRFAPNGYYMRHAMIGLNPKVRIAGATQFEREKHSGTFYLGIDGLAEDGTVDRAGPGYAHCDCQFDRPNIWVDGRPIVEDGHLLALDDPGIREAAKRFGPPNVLLDDNPIIALPTRDLTLG